MPKNVRHFMKWRKAIVNTRNAGTCLKWQLTHSTNNLYENAEIIFLNYYRNSPTVTSYENALEQALQITYSVLFHKVIKVLFFIIILAVD